MKKIAERDTPSSTQEGLHVMYVTFSPPRFLADPAVLHDGKSNDAPRDPGEMSNVW